MLWDTWAYDILHQMCMYWHKYLHVTHMQVIFSQYRTGSTIASWNTTVCDDLEYFSDQIDGEFGCV